MDWSVECAKEVDAYLQKCRTQDERIELLAAYLRRERSKGAVDGVAEVGKRMFETA